MRVSSPLAQASTLHPRPTFRHGPKIVGDDVPPCIPHQTPRESANRVGAGFALGLSLVGAVAGMAAPAQAQVQMQTPVQQPKSLLDSIQAFPSEHTLVRPDSTEKSFTFSQINDSMPGFLEPLVPANAKVPGLNRSDDDGWTAELRQEFVATQGADQWVLASRYSMLTQRGAWEPVAPDYQGLRTDLLEIGVQRNWKQSLGDRTDLVYGVGAGVQSLGPLGGHRLQESFHIHGGFGGRVGDDLQNLYSTASATVYPLVSAGVGVHHRLDHSNQWTVKGTLAATAPLGPGLTTLRAETGLEYRPWSRVTFDAGVNLSAVHSNHRAMDFLPSSGVRPGAYVGAEVNLVRQLNAFARVETHGVRGEPVYLIGFTIGGGPRPWLNPLW